MHKLLTIAVLLVLGGCAAPQDQVLKRMPIASQQAAKPVNCVTNHERYYSSYTVCK